MISAVRAFVKVCPSPYDFRRSWAIRALISLRRALMAARLARATPAGDASNSAFRAAARSARSRAHCAAAKDLPADVSLRLRTASFSVRRFFSGTPSSFLAASALMPELSARTRALSASSFLPSALRARSRARQYFSRASQCSASRERFTSCFLCIRWKCAATRRVRFAASINDAASVVSPRAIASCARRSRSLARRPYSRARSMFGRRSAPGPT